jgi:hypothetical protein
MILKGMEDVKKEQFFTKEKGVRGVMNSNYLSLAVAWTVESMHFPIELIIGGIICHWMLLHATLSIALSIRLMLFWIARGLCKSVMTFFPLSIDLPTVLLHSGYVKLR